MLTDETNFKLKLKNLFYLGYQEAKSLTFKKEQLVHCLQVDLNGVLHETRQSKIADSVDDLLNYLKGKKYFSDEHTFRKNLNVLFRKEYAKRVIKKDILQFFRRPKLNKSESELLWILHTKSQNNHDTNVVGDLIIHLQKELSFWKRVAQFFSRIKESFSKKWESKELELIVLFIKTTLPRIGQLRELILDEQYALMKSQINGFYALIQKEKMLVSSIQEEISKIPGITGISRKEFIVKTGLVTAGILLAGSLIMSDDHNSQEKHHILKPVQKKLPRWRGFNLQGMYADWVTEGFLESDFKLMKKLEGGNLTFDFVRLPLNYTYWLSSDDYSDINNIYKIDESQLKKIDQVVKWGMKYGMHVSLCFHRAPGYSSHGADPFKISLWEDKEAQDAFYFHWKLFSERYKSVSRNSISFNLVNEPPWPNPAIQLRKKYARVVTQATKVIRRVSPNRLIFVDGLNYGRIPLVELNSLDIAQSCRGYDPYKFTHYLAPWANNSQNFPKPEWPSTSFFEKLDKNYLINHYLKWIDLAKSGVGVHCGELGCYNKTPHEVFLRWLEDILIVFKQLNVGYAFWDFRGPFGILDSGREDVEYENFHGHKLDRKMLELLQKY